MLQTSFPHPAPAPHIVCLAASDVGKVTLCPHSGALVLHLRYLSLRFDASAFEDLGLLLGHAQARLHHHKQVVVRLREGAEEWSGAAPAAIKEPDSRRAAHVPRTQPHLPSIGEARR